MSKPRQKRKVLRVSKEGLLHQLKIIATHGVREQGSEAAIQMAREAFYYQLGNEKIPLTREEAGKIIHQ